MPDPADRRARRPRWPLPALLLGAALAAHAGPRDPLYRWTDDAGAVRYTTERERIPAAHREEAVRVELPPEVPEAEEAPGEPSPDGAPAVESPPPVAPPSASEARIAALERAIAADQAALADAISDPERAADLGASDEVAAIAERLPRLQAELRALRAGRAPTPAPDAP